MGATIAHHIGMGRRKIRPPPPSEWAQASADELLRKTGLVVKRLREAKKYSQEDLAHGSDMHKNTIEGIENRGANLSLKNYHLLAKALGTSLRAILDMVDSDMEVRASIVERFRDSPARKFENVSDAEIDWLWTQPPETTLGANASPKGGPLYDPCSPRQFVKNTHGSR